MGENEYRISLGIDLNTDDLQQQINEAGRNAKPIKLDIEFGDINKDIKAIKTQLEGLGKNGGLTLNTQSLENSLRDIHSLIKDVKASLGSVDNGSGMKSLLSSVNQIATALGRVTDESETLVKSLSALSKKDFGINLGVKLGGGSSPSNNAAFGDYVRQELYPELKRQEQAITKYLAQYYKTNEISAVDKLYKSSGRTGGFQNVWSMLEQLKAPIKKNDVLGDRISQFRNFFREINEMSKMQGIDLSPVMSQFDRQADEIIQTANDIKNGTAQVKNNFEELKNVFGGNVDGEKLSAQLDSIVVDLGEIKSALQEVSSGSPLEGLTQSFDRLSASIDTLVQNCTNVRTAINDSVDNLNDSVNRSSTNIGGEFANSFDNSMESIQTSAAETSGVIENLKTTLETMRLDRSSIDAVTKDVEELGFEITEASVKMKNGNFDITVKGVDSLGRAVAEMRHLDSATGEISGVGRTISQSFSTSDDVIREVNKEMANFVKLQSQIGDIKVKIGNLEAVGGKSNQVAELKRQLEELENTYARLMHTFSKKLTTNADIISTEDIVKFDNEIASATEKAENKLRELDAKVADTRAELAKSLEIKLESGKFAIQVDKVHSDAKKLSSVSSKLQVKLDALDNAEDAMNRAFNDGSVEEKIAAYNKYKTVLESVKIQLEQNKIAEQDASNAAKLKDDRMLFQNKIDSWMAKNSAATKQFGARLREMRAEAQNCDRVTLNRLEAELKQIDKAAEGAGKKMQSFGDRLKTQFSKYSSYFSIASVFMYAEQGLRNMFEQVKLIDSAMTELKKVTDETDEAYNQFLTNAASKSKEIGTTIDGLVSSTADFARLGYDFKDAQGLAEVANIYAVVGDEIDGVEQATESLISTMAAFKDEMNGMSNSEFAMSIVDKFNEIGNNFAISSGGIGEALERSASSLMAANNTIDESIALITAANTVVQDPEVVGTAFKTISMRIRGAKTELEEAGLETEGMVESTATLRAEIEALSGVDIMENGNEFKSTYKIMDELAQKWEDLSDIQQATVTELIAGKRQGNIVSSLMTNFDTARDALETSLNSSGSAMQEHEKWQQSLEARINSLKASWQSLSQSFLQSDFLKGALDAVIGLVDGITALIDTFGTLPTLATAFAIFQSFKGEGIFRPIIDEATGAATGMTSIFGQAARESKKALQSIGLQGDSAFKKGLEADKAALSQYMGAVREGMSETDAFNRYLKDTSVAFQEYINSGKLAANGIEGFYKQQQLAEVSLQAQNKSLGNARILMKEYHSATAETGNVCQTTGLAQQDFADAVKQTNPQLATAMTASSGARGGMVKYTASLVGAKVASLGLKVATMTLNTALTMGIGLLISWAIEGLDKLIKTSSELAEEVDELTSKFKEQHGELTKGKSSFQSEAERYAKLSRGVGKLGENISLTADEYSEYQTIVNSIADQIPSLVSGYDSQGNAILNVKGNVDKLTTAYEKLIHTQNQSILTQSGNIEQAFADTLEDASGEGWFGNNHGFWKGLLANGVLYPFATFADYDMKQNTVDDIQSVLNAASEKEREEILKKYAFTYVDPENTSEIAPNRFGRLEIEDMLESIGYDVGFSEDPIEVFKKALEENPRKIQDYIDAYYGQFAEAVEKQKTIATAKLSEVFDVRAAIRGLTYDNIGEEMRPIFDEIVSSLDYEFFVDLKERGISVEDWVTDLLDQFNNLGAEANNRIETAFNLETQFNGGEISYGEFAEGIKDAGKFIDTLDLDGEYKTQLKLNLGLDEDGILDGYRKLRKRLADSEYFLGMPSEYIPFIDDLSSEEVSVLWKIIPELEETEYKETIDEIKAVLKREMMLEGLTFELNLEVESAGIESLNTAMKESVTATGLSADSIKALKGRYSELESQGYDLSTVFEETAQGVHLNRQEFDKLEKAYASQKLTEVNGQLDEMQRVYDQLGEDIRNCADPVEKSKLFSDRQLLAKRISEAATLATQYQGLTSAYNDWLAAEEAGQERDMYENILEGFENIGDEISRGWTDDGTIKFLELLTGRTDLVGKSAKELKGIYKGLDKEIENTSYSIRDFFTVDEDGNSTSTGVYNFLRALQELESSDTVSSVLKKQFKDIENIEDLVTVKDGKITAFNFEVVGGDKAVADALGISEELVQIMVRAADDAGFVVTMDGTFKQFADLEKEARAAVDYINELFGEDYSFDFNTSSIDSLNEQLEEAHKILDNKDFWNADGTFNFDAKGATQAMQIVSTLQARLDTLTQEQYGIGLTVEDDELEEPLKNLQNYGRNIAALNQLELNPKANAEEIEELNKELDKIAEYFADLDDEKKVEIGLVTENGKTAFTEEYFDNLSKEKKIEIGLVNDKGEPLTDYIDAVQKKIEDGEITIPTVLDIQANMDKNIETLADLALLNSGLLSEDEEEVIKKKYQIDTEIEKGNSYVDPDLVTVLSPDQQTRRQNIQIIAETFGVDDVDDLDNKLKGLDDKTIQAIAEVVGQANVDLLKDTLARIEPTKVEAIAEAIGQGDVDALKTAINQLEPTQVQAIAEAFGFDEVSDLNAAIEDLDPKVVQAVAQALGIPDVESLKGAIDSLDNKDVKAIATASGKTEVDNLNQSINNLDDKTVTVTTVMQTIHKVVDRGATAGKKALENRNLILSKVNGTANVDGTTGRAFKQGSWGTKNSGTALVGELGAETLVRNGRYYTIGNNGAEFIKYQRGDIIFNHKQTEELFKYGKVTSDGGRAKSFVGGTAFAQGAAFSFGEGGGDDDVGGSSDGDKFEEVIDWIEVILDRVERSIDKFEQQANNIYKSWSSRNEALLNQISEVNKEIGLQQQAYDRYIQEADSVGLSEKWVEKVQEGSISIDDEKDFDEDTYEKIKEYQEWYEKALDCEKAIEELKETEASLYAQRLENVSTQYEGILGVIEHEKNILEEYISQNEANAQLISANYYNALISNENKTITQLEKQKADMLSTLQEAMNAKDEKGNPLITKGSQSWYELVNKIDEVTLSIAQSETQLKEYQQTLQQLSWERFDLLQDKISAVTEEADFLIEILSSDKLYDDNGQLTNSGMATMGQHGVAYNTYMYQSELARAEAEKIKKELAKDPYDTELEERYREMISLQQEHILAAQNEKEAIRDMVEEGIELELDALQERIDKYNEALDSQKDLYDYQKRVKEQTEEIASLEKQMAAYQGDNSEEARQKIQQLKVDLESAREELQETEYDKYISDQQQMLDELYLSYEETLNTRLDNLDALVSDMIVEVNANATTISSTLSEKAESVGYTLSDSMKTIWDTNTTNTNGVITTYGEKFSSAQTTTNNSLKTINTNLQNMITQLNTLAKTNVKSASVSSAANSKQADTPKTEKPKTDTPKTETPKAIKVGGKINAKGAQIYDYAGDKSGERQLFRNDPIYKVLKTDGNWLQVRWHKLSKGITGWFKKGDVKALATGARRIASNDVAWTQEKGQEFIVRPSDGAILTPVAKGDSVLNASASNNIWNMANSPAEFIKDNLSLGVGSVPNNSNVSNTYQQNLDKVVFNFPNVKNYEELLAAMQKDKNFERLILSLSIDQIAGKSSLAKGKAIR